MKSNVYITGLVCLALGACAGAEPEPKTSPEMEPASLVLVGGKVVTVDSDFSIVEAVAVKGDKIMALGTTAAVEKHIGPKTKVVKLEGGVVLPGLIDAHAHLTSLADELAYLDINGTKSFDEVVALVKKRVEIARPGEWIVGGRWDHNDWPDKAFPVHEALSRVSPDNPVYLRRVDGNSGFANRKAMELAGIGRDTPDPPGGKIIRSKDGEPTGVLINQAMNLVKKQIPKDSKQAYREKFLNAVSHCLELGLTSVHEAGVGPHDIALYKELIDEGRLPLRIYAMLGDQEKPTMEGDLLAHFKKHRIEGYGDSFLSVRSIKLFFDGALGSRGAAFFEPYCDDPGNRGLLRVTPEYIQKVAEAALEADMGVNTHAIGIRGNRLCLQAYERALETSPKKDHRFTMYLGSL